jgi:hypothetical protein
MNYRASIYVRISQLALLILINTHSRNLKLGYKSFHMIVSNYSQTILIMKSTVLWVEIPCSLERYHVSEEHNASIFRVKEYVK